MQERWSSLFEARELSKRDEKWLHLLLSTFGEVRSEEKMKSGTWQASFVAVNINCPGQVDGLQRVDVKSTWRCASGLMRSSQSTTVPSMQTWQVSSCLIAAQERGVGWFTSSISLNSGVYSLASEAARLPKYTGIVVETRCIDIEHGRQEYSKRRRKVSRWCGEKRKDRCRRGRQDWPIDDVDYCLNIFPRKLNCWLIREQQGYHGRDRTRQCYSRFDDCSQKRSLSSTSWIRWYASRRLHTDALQFKHWLIELA
jgi:hypothetical protein